jgi:hypothetical protein
MQGMNYRNEFRFSKNGMVTAVLVDVFVVILYPQGDPDLHRANNSATSSGCFYQDSQIRQTCRHSQARVR